MKWMVLLVVGTASAGLLIGAPASGGALDPVLVDVPFGAAVPGTSLGANLTDATVSISGTLLETTTTILYLNNTDTAVYHARLEVVSTTNLANLGVLDVGIDNGTATDQITILSGVITDSDGAFVRLEPSSTNTIYVTQSLLALSASGLTVDVITADAPDENAYVVTRAALSLT